MFAAGVPTAEYAVVHSVENGIAAVPRYPVVLKADGLAAGKGVVIAGDEADAAGTRSRRCSSRSASATCRSWSRSS